MYEFCCLSHLHLLFIAFCKLCFLLVLVIVFSITLQVASVWSILIRFITFPSELLTCCFIVRMYMTFIFVCLFAILKRRISNVSELLHTTCSIFCMLFSLTLSSTKRNFNGCQLLRVPLLRLCSDWWLQTRWWGTQTRIEQHNRKSVVRHRDGYTLAANIALKNIEKVISFHSILVAPPCMASLYQQAADFSVFACLHQIG